jgi:hypothetical protein
MESYVKDYESYEGSAARRYEMLEEDYFGGAPDLSHLVPGDGGAAESALWSMRDMAIILGRNVSNVLRTIRRMESRPEWSAVLAGHEFRREKSGREAAVLYGAGVFDVIVDYFESVYLERFTRPRRGEPMTGEERQAAYSLWSYMKANPDAAGELGTSRLIGGGLARVPGLGQRAAALYQNLRGIMKRAFSIKLGTFFLLIFALAYELSKKHPFLNIAVPALSAAALASVLIAMGRRRAPQWLADAGACSITLFLLWALAMIASPGGPSEKLLPGSSKNIAPASSTSAVNAGRLERTAEGASSASDGNDPERPEVKADYSRALDDGNFDIWIHTGPRTKEILYRTSPSGDFRSAGFSKDSGPDGARRPLRALTLDPESAENLWIKYIDDAGKTHGPYKINFDHRAERVKEARRMLDDNAEWVDFTRGESGTSVSSSVASDLEFSLGGAGIVERVMYGVNRRTPDRERVLSPVGEGGDGFSDMPGPPVRKLPLYLLTDSKEKIWFVSMKIIFSDGSESDVRIFDNPYAEN